MILINIDLPELESISSEGYSLWSPRKVVMNSIYLNNNNTNQYRCS